MYDLILLFFLWRFLEKKKVSVGKWPVSGNVSFCHRFRAPYGNRIIKGIKYWRQRCSVNNVLFKGFPWTAPYCWYNTASSTFMVLGALKFIWKVQWINTVFIFILEGAEILVLHFNKIWKCRPFWWTPKWNLGIWLKGNDKISIHFRT